MAANSPPFAWESDLALLNDTALAAGEIALKYFQSENRSWTKHGDSPVSDADIEVDAFLRHRLRAARPDHDWLSEESPPELTSAAGRPVFVVDPIDGTRGFLAGDPQWCVCIAIVQNGRPLTAVVHCPALGRTFAAVLGQGAWLNGLPIAMRGRAELRVITSTRRVNAELERLYGERFEILPYVPSLAYRIMLVANGEADAAIARAGAHDWDLAAADLVLSQAGGTITTLTGEPLQYLTSRGRAPALLAAGAGRQQALASLAKNGGFLQ